MKKLITILGLCVLVIGVAAFATTNNYSKLSNQEATAVCGTPLVFATGLEIYLEEKLGKEVYFSLGTWSNPVTKSKLLSAITVEDILPGYDTENIIHYNSVTYILVKDGKRTTIQAKNESDTISKSQREFFARTDAFSKFVIEVDCIEKSPETGEKFRNVFNPHYCVAPKTHATYSDGDTALVNYIRKETQRIVEENTEPNLSFAKVFFTISKDGQLQNLQRDQSCGIPELDKAVELLILNAPGKWIPAKDENGNNVQQELVFSFGQGC